MAPKGPRIVMLCNPGSPRVDAFLHACERLNLPSPTIVPYIDVINGRADLASVVPEGAVVRLESPGRDFAVERELLKLGGLENADKLQFEPGEIRSPDKWYRGWCKALDRIEEQLAPVRNLVRMNDGTEIKAMYDKPSCQQMLRDAGMPVPRIVGTVQSFEELHSLAKERAGSRLFLKIANGSSASGVVAFAANAQGQFRAVTTVEMHDDGGNLRLFNNRRVRRYESLKDVSTLVDALGAYGLHVEQWIPKASLNNRMFDFRIVVVEGRAANSTARLSETPLTNLHLLNERMDIAALRDRLPKLDWRGITESCEKAMGAVFPRSLYAGLDVVVTNDLKSHAIVEVNAFGDHLNNVLHDGKTSQHMELLALTERCRTDA